MNGADRVQRLHRVGEPQHPSNRLRCVERAVFENGSQRSTGNVFGDPRDRTSRNFDTIWKGAGRYLSHHIDERREVSMRDAARGRQRALSRGFANCHDHQPPRRHLDGHPMSLVAARKQRAFKAVAPSKRGSGQSHEHRAIDDRRRVRPACARIVASRRSTRYPSADAECTGNLRQLVRQRDLRLRVSERESSSFRFTHRIFDAK
jgi:hypothetical protein